MTTLHVLLRLICTMGALWFPLAHAAAADRDTRRIIKLIWSEFKTNGTCAIDPVSLSNIIRVNAGNSNAVQYAAYWRGDFLCLGGSGSITENLALVEVGAKGVKLIGRLDRTFPDIIQATKVGAASRGRISVEGWAYADDDPVFRPSQYERITIVPTKDGWKTVDRQLLDDPADRSN